MASNNSETKSDTIDGIKSSIQSQETVEEVKRGVTISSSLPECEDLNELPTQKENSKDVNVMFASTRTDESRNSSEKEKWRLSPSLSVLLLLALMATIAGFASGLFATKNSPVQEEEPQWCGFGFRGNGTCPFGACCSRYNKCGWTEEHCTDGQVLAEDFFRTDRFCGGGAPGNGTCEDPSMCCSPEALCEKSYYACGGWWFNTTRGAPCGRGVKGDGICEVEGECCSQDYWCGTTNSYCNPEGMTPLQNASVDISAVATTLAATATAVSLVVTVFVYIYRSKSSIRMAQLEFLYILLAGLCIISLGSFVESRANSMGTCVASVWLINIGYSLELVPLVVKTAALHRVMSAGRRMRRVPNITPALFKSVTVICSLVLLYLAVWTALDPPGETSSEESSCVSESNVWWAASMSWQFLLVVISAWLAFQNRNYREDLSDTRTLAMMIYSHFIFLLLRLVTHIVEGNNTSDTDYQAYRSIIVGSDVLTTSLIYFLPKFLVIGDSSRDLQDRRVFVSGSFHIRPSRLNPSVSNEEADVDLSSRNHVQTRLDTANEHMEDKKVYNV